MIKFECTSLLTYRFIYWFWWSEVQKFERGSISRSMPDVRWTSDARWSMPDARSFERRWSMPDVRWASDARWSMHGELRMLDGRCTMHVLWKSIVNAHETLAFPRNQRKPKRFEQTSIWVNRKHRWWSKISLVDGKGKDETMFWKR